MLQRLCLAVMMLVSSSVAQAATVTLISMQYSAAAPVPHIAYDGETVAGDTAAVQAVVEKFIKCGLDCSTPDGGPVAVLTLNGPGGDYREGLTLATYLRAANIATVIERDAQCYSACAFAFLGGSAYSTQEGVGTYIDRQIEPGGILGFHAPYFQNDQLLEVLKEVSPSEVMGAGRGDLALMVEKLVEWNVDPLIISFMMTKGPEETYNVVSADDYYMVRAALPPTPTSSWISDLPSAVRNACLRLLALDYGSDPLALKDLLDQPWTENLGPTAFGAVSGFHWSDALLDIGSCGITEQSAATEGDYEVALYWNPGVDGLMEGSTAFFNRQHGWSSAGPGRNPLHRLFQKDSMNHFFLPVGVPIDDLDLPGEAEIARNRFSQKLYPLLPNLDARMEVVTYTPAARVSHSGDVWMFEQVGPKLLFEAAGHEPRPVTLLTDSADDSGFSRSGQYADGTMFSTFGFLDGESATVVHLMVLKEAGVAPTESEVQLMHELECGLRSIAPAVGCS